MLPEKEERDNLSLPQMNIFSEKSTRPSCRSKIVILKQDRIILETMIIKYIKVVQYIVFSKSKENNLFTGRGGKKRKSKILLFLIS